MSELTPFHLAIPVRDISEAREFYGGVLGFEEGRSDATWVDFNCFGHQLVCHLDPALGPAGKVRLHHNPVDAKAVPVPHFGVVLSMEDWLAWSESLHRQQLAFVIEPHIRFKGQPGEQATLFFLDPSGNALEFKAFHDIDAELFRR